VRKRQHGTADTTGALFACCPRCYSRRAPLVWALDADTGARTYRCTERSCGARWQVDGVQATLDLGSVPDQLTLLGTDAL
jgi:hypothetical protein